MCSCRPGVRSRLEMEFPCSHISVLKSGSKLKTSGNSNKIQTTISKQQRFRSNSKVIPAPPAVHPSA
ncbi:hypothetical protein AAFF_G00286110 [Aldrovandia affinis]|uniref:Uncharacterized protein n=1 Tax=Aldrovandia affinis TaxID=143900 RepID=A0AAD7TAH5_9TELE|nr:hypothetical protein AAFF_G00286110 [Aldrovandia affinis]